MRIDRVLSPAVAALLVGVSGALLAGLATLDMLNDRETFAAITLVLIGYLVLEIVRLRRWHPDQWLLNPVVLCTVSTFLAAHGPTNILFFAPENQLDLLSLVPEVSPAMVKLMALALLGAVAMWLGYWSSLAARISRRGMLQRFRSNCLPTTNALRPLTLPTLVTVATGSRLLMIHLGIFGYSSTYDRLIELGSISQYLSMASGLGSMALVLASLQLYRQRASARNRLWLIATLTIELIFGLLSGFKSAVVMPFLVVIVCQYICTGKPSKHWLMLALFGLIAGYAVIEPFRVMRNDDADFSGTSVVSIGATLLGAAGTSTEAVAETAPILLSFGSRFNLSYISSFGIDFADANLSLPAGSPAFLQDILLAPLHAWIPRLLWEGKPLGNLGLWYNQVVMGKDHFSSTAMGPVAYLYFAGGAIAVFLGFFFVGIVHRSLYFLLQPSSSSAGAVILLAVLAPLASIDSAFNSFIIMLCRDLPLVILLQFLIFQRRARRSLGKKGFGAGDALSAGPAWPVAGGIAAAPGSAP